MKVQLTSNPYDRRKASVVDGEFNVKSYQMKKLDRMLLEHASSDSFERVKNVSFGSGEMTEKASKTAESKLIISIAPELNLIPCKNYQVGGLGCVSAEEGLEFVKNGYDVRTYIPYHTYSMKDDVQNLSTMGVHVLNTKDPDVTQSKMDIMKGGNISEDAISRGVLKKVVDPVAYELREGEKFVILREDGKSYLELEKLKDNASGTIEVPIRSASDEIINQKQPYQAFKFVLASERPTLNLEEDLEIGKVDSTISNLKNSQSKYDFFNNIRVMYTPRLSVATYAYGNNQPNIAGSGYGGGSGATNNYGTPLAQVDERYTDFNRAIVDQIQKEFKQEESKPFAAWLHDRDAFIFEFESYKGKAKEYFDHMSYHATLHNPGKAYQGKYKNPIAFSYIAMDAKQMRDLMNDNGGKNYEYVKKSIELMDLLYKKRQLQGLTTENTEPYELLDKSVKETLDKIFGKYIGNFRDKNGQYNMTSVALASSVVDPEHYSAGSVSLNYQKECNSNQDVSPDLDGFYDKMDKNGSLMPITNGTEATNLATNAPCGNNFKVAPNGANLPNKTPYIIPFDHMGLNEGWLEDNRNSINENLKSKPYYKKYLGEECSGILDKSKKYKYANNKVVENCATVKNKLPETFMSLKNFEKVKFLLENKTDKNKEYLKGVLKSLSSDKSFVEDALKKSGDDLNRFISEQENKLKNTAKTELGEKSGLTLAFEEARKLNDMLKDSSKPIDYEDMESCINGLRREAKVHKEIENFDGYKIFQDDKTDLKNMDIETIKKNAEKIQKAISEKLTKMDVCEYTYSYLNDIEKHADFTASKMNSVLDLMKSKGFNKVELNYSDFKNNIDSLTSAGTELFAYIKNFNMSYYVDMFTKDSYVPNDSVKTHSNQLHLLFDNGRISGGNTIAGSWKPLKDLSKPPIFLMGWGRFDFQKGFPVAVEIMKEVFRDDTIPADIKERIRVEVGGGPFSKGYEWEACKAQIEAVNKEFPDYADQIIVNGGFVANKKVPCATFSFLTSRFEPCGLTQEESIVGMTPVVAIKTGGLPDTVKTKGDQATGYLTKDMYMVNVSDEQINSYVSNTSLEKIQEDFKTIKGKNIVSIADIDPNANPLATVERKADIVDIIRAHRVAIDGRDTLKKALTEFVESEKNLKHADKTEYYRRVFNCSAELNRLGWSSNREANGVYGKSAQEQYTQNAFKEGKGKGLKSSQSSDFSRFYIADKEVRDFVYGKYSEIVSDFKVTDADLKKLDSAIDVVLDRAVDKSIKSGKLSKSAKVIGGVVASVAIVGSAIAGLLYSFSKDKKIKESANERYSNYIDSQSKALQQDSYNKINAAV